MKGVGMALKEMGVENCKNQMYSGKMEPMYSGSGSKAIRVVRRCIISEINAQGVVSGCERCTEYFVHLWSRSIPWC